MCGRRVGEFNQTSITASYTHLGLSGPRPRVSAGYGNARAVGGVIAGVVERPRTRRDLRDPAQRNDPAPADAESAVAETERPEGRSGPDPCGGRPWREEIARLSPRAARGSRYAVRAVRPRRVRVLADWPGAEVAWGCVSRSLNI